MPAISPTATPVSAPSTPAAEPTPIRISEGANGYVWQVHRDVAYYTIPDSEWDFAISCEAKSGALLFMTQNIDAAPPVPYDDFEIGGVRRQLPAAFEPEGLGLVRSRIALGDRLVRALASGRTMLRVHNAGGEMAEIGVPAEVAAMVARCRSKQKSDGPA